MCVQGGPRCSMPGRNRGRKKETHRKSTREDGTWRCGHGHGHGRGRGRGQGGSPSPRPLVLPRGTGCTWWLSSCLGNGLGGNGGDAGVAAGLSPHGGTSSLGNILAAWRWPTQGPPQSLIRSLDSFPNKPPAHSSVSGSAFAWDGGPQGCSD